MVSYDNQPLPAGSVAMTRIGGTQLQAFEGSGMPKAAFLAQEKQFQAQVQQALAANGFPGIVWSTTSAGPGRYTAT